MLAVGTFIAANIASTEFYEVTLKDDLQEGEARSVQVGPEEADAVLLCKVNGKLHCVSRSCPHYGVNLAFGVLFGNKIKCPAHNATFNVTDGAPDEGPMLDGLQKFPVEVHGD